MTTLLGDCLASTNIIQSSPNLVRMYMAIRAQMSSIMELIGPETDQVVGSGIRKFAIFDYVYTLASANIYQSVPNLATIYMSMRARMSLIMGLIDPKHSDLFALEFGKNAKSDFVYTLASTNIDQSAPNLIKMYRARFRL